MNTLDDTLSLFDIDRENLIAEFSQHTRMYGEYALKLADARKHLEERKAKYEIVQAELSLAVRKNPEEFGLEKTTEAMVQAAVVVHETSKIAHTKVINAKHQMDVLQATVTTLDQRKSCIEALLKLLLGEFYSMPKIPNETKAELSKRSRA